MTSDIIRGFDRDTFWLATGVVGTLIFAALTIALEERRPKARQAESGFLLNPDPASVGSVVAESSKANGEMTLGPGGSVDQAFTETALQEIPSSGREFAPTIFTAQSAVASTSAPAISFTLKMNRNAYRQDSARAIEPKARDKSNRSPVASRYVGVKRRLIELWHQSLARSEKARSWTAFANLTSGAKKKAAYTAEKNH